MKKIIHIHGILSTNASYSCKALVTFSSLTSILNANAILKLRAQISMSYGDIFDGRASSNQQESGNQQIPGEKRSNFVLCLITATVITLFTLDSITYMKHSIQLSQIELVTTLKCPILRLVQGQIGMEFEAQLTSIQVPTNNRKYTIPRYQKVVQFFIPLHLHVAYREVDILRNNSMSLLT